MPPLTLFPCFLVRTQLVDLSVCLLLLLLLLLTVVDHRHHGHHGPNCLLSGPTTCTTFTSPITFTTCFHHLFTVYDCDLSTITAAAQWRVIRSIRARLTFAAVWATSSVSVPAGRMSWRRRSATVLLSPLLLITRSGVHDRAGLFMLYSISLVACWPCVSLSAPFVIYQSLSLSFSFPSN